MNLKVGDKVIFKKEKDHGKIVMLIGDFKAIVLNSEGFKVPVLIDDLIIPNKDNQELEKYQEQDFIEDNNEKIIKTQSKKQKKPSRRKEIDLHVDPLIKEYNKLSNSEIISLQMKHCEIILNNSLDTHIEELIIIHGIGLGVLKQNVHDLLTEYNLRFFLSRDGGSTIVLL